VRQPTTIIKQREHERKGMVASPTLNKKDGGQRAKCGAAFDTSTGIPGLGGAASGAMSIQTGRRAASRMETTLFNHLTLRAGWYLFHKVGSMWAVHPGRDGKETAGSEDLLSGTGLHGRSP